MKAKITKLLIFVISGISVSLAAQSPGSTLTWKAHSPNSDERFVNGMDARAIFSNQATVSVTPISENGKLAVVVLIENPDKGAGRLEVIPDDVHVFKTSDKGVVELKRESAEKIAKSIVHRQRVAAFGSGFAAGSSQQTGTVTSSDGTTSQVTIHDSSAQNASIAQSRDNIHQAQAAGAALVDEELKRNTLDPGQTAMGKLFYPHQKKGTPLIARVAVNGVIYEFPIETP
jgi:hypothetical protein